MDDEAKGIYDRIRADKELDLKERDVDSMVDNRSRTADISQQQADTQSRSVDNANANSIANREQTDRHFKQELAFKHQGLAAQSQQFYAKLNQDEQQSLRQNQLGYAQLNSQNYWNGMTYLQRGDEFAATMNAKGAEFAHRVAQDRFTAELKVNEEFRARVDWRAKDIERQAEWAFKTGDPEALAEVYSSVRNGHSVSYIVDDGKHRFVDQSGRVVAEAEDAKGVMVDMQKRADPKTYMEIAKSEAYTKYMDANAQYLRANAARTAGEEQRDSTAPIRQIGDAYVISGVPGAYLVGENGQLTDVTTGLPPKAMAAEAKRQARLASQQSPSPPSGDTARPTEGGSPPTGIQTSQLRYNSRSNLGLARDQALRVERARATMNDAEFDEWYRTNMSTDTNPYAPPRPASRPLGLAGHVRRDPVLTQWDEYNARFFTGPQRPR
jgi:hypothetical protein